MLVMSIEFFKNEFELAFDSFDFIALSILLKDLALKVNFLSQHYSLQLIFYLLNYYYYILEEFFFFLSYFNYNNYLALNIELTAVGSV